MLFWKKKKYVQERLSPHGVISDGYSAVLEAETAAKALLGILDPSENACFKESRKCSPSLVTGSAMTGCRAAAIVNELEESGALKVAVSQRLPMVVHLICKSVHDGYYTAAETGCAQMFATSAQQAADFALIAHRIAELSLTPVLSAQDAHTAHSLQQLSRIESDKVLAYLGEEVAQISASTASQKILFGEKRFGVPCLSDLDNPATAGIIEDSGVFSRSAVAEKVFFLDHLAEIVDRAFQEFEKITGRSYARVICYRIEDAQYAIVAQGAVIEDLRAVVELLRSREKLRVGVIGVAMLRPFPGPEIAELLKGKKAVTVLERSAGSLGEDLPLLKEVRCALDRAMENGFTAADAPYPGYPIYRRFMDRPLLFSGSYGLGGQRTPLSDLKAAFYNMVNPAIKRRRFYLGVSGDPVASRFPKHEVMQQRVYREYPHLRELCLSADAPLNDFPEEVKAFRIYLSQEHKWVGDLFSETLANSVQEKVKTALPYMPASDQMLPYTAVLAKDFSNHSVPDVVNIAVMPDYELLLSPSPISCVKSKGTLIIESDLEPGELWKQISLPIRAQMNSANIHCHIFRRRKTVCEVTSMPQHEALISDHIRLGALLAVASYGDLAQNSFLEQYRRGLTLRLKSNSLVNECMTAIRAGQALMSFEWQALRESPKIPEEPAPPWTVEQVPAKAETVFNLSRFWNCSGYFYASGKKDHITIEPSLATGTIPARSSAFRDLARTHSFIPNWIIENCTGCGLCWAICPDSAIPGTVQDFSGLFQSAIQQCKNRGLQINELPRLEKHLGREAYRLIVNDGVYNYRTLGKLLKDGFTALMEKMEITPEQKNAMTGEFQKIYEVVEHFPIARTDPFFHEPEKAEKGSGALLSILVNPATCKGCMTCVAVCPKKALEAIVQNEEREAIYRKNWQYFMHLNSDPKLIVRHIRGVETLVYHLLDKKAYFSLVGGDTSPAGSAEKSAIHILAAAVEARMGESLRPFIERLKSLIQGLEQKIQEMANKSVEIRNWESFGQSLSDVGRQNIDAKILAELLDKSGVKAEIDRQRLARMTSLLTRIKELYDLYRQGSNGDGRARMAMVSSTECMEWGRQYPYSPYSFPCAYHRDPGAAALGAFEGIMRKMADTFSVVRMAELEMENAYNSKMHDEFFENFTWRDFTEQERGLCPPLFVVEDVKSANWQGIFDLVSQRLPVKVVILDRSGKEASWVKPGLMFLAYQEVFVAQTTPAVPAHFIASVMEGLKSPGPVVFCIHAPWRGEAILHAELAVRSRVFPLFKYDPISGLDIGSNPFPTEDWAREALQGARVTPAHWAIQNPAWDGHWKICPAAKWHSKMKPLDEYLSPGAKDRTGLIPVIEIEDEEHRPAYAELSESLLRFTEECFLLWRFLRSIATATPPALPPDAEQILKQREQQIRSECEQKLQKLDQEHGAVYRQRLKSALLSLCGPDSLSINKGIKRLIL